ncbi:M23 family peptidase (plasmid) [Brasilonema octagenarum UFV-E1]|uniref:M23 family peptidase n=2 Tax=Brasilonema TaxID=383614 RepID=A0A856MPV2_9CYAN|nr:MULTISPECIES: M23 family metallopeptidase [Brasilonema]NMF65726.1 M23 family peptidase [Brasilonema octagenarum UFV-OR1]QDL12569.1 M23 family peptidase [Brasilonema sennae CENA114]QDL18963.1 M23 family peptidase [Brasilonema octagenarum UFV-E1]
MRLVVDFQASKAKTKLSINNTWNYAIATSVLVAAMVIPQVSGWVESQQLVKSLQSALQHQTQSSDDNKTFSSGRFVFPTATGTPVTSEFGWRTHPITGERKFHSGIDFGASMGTPIYAADSGQVVSAGDKRNGYGNAVIIQHQGNISTLYGHANELYVQEGQQVIRGQMIATVGSTGFSTGPHLHFEVRSYGVAQNPRPYLHEYLINR